jgi:hypothetical protein
MHYTLQGEREFGDIANKHYISMCGKNNEEDCHK